MPDKAKEYCQKLLLAKSVSVSTLTTSAWVMLFNDRNANGALDLAEKALSLSPENFIALHRKGWALYKLGKYRESLAVMQKSWDIRTQTAAPYNHETYLHLEAAKKAVEGLKNN
jgi:tetratricopeptide (TPR) repeat protein